MALIFNIAALIFATASLIFATFLYTQVWMFFGSGGIIKALDTVSRGVRSGCIRCMTDEQQVEFLNDTIKYLESYITKKGWYKQYFFG